MIYFVMLTLVLWQHVVCLCVRRTVFSVRWLWMCVVRRIESHAAQHTTHNHNQVHSKQRNITINTWHKILETKLNNVKKKCLYSTYSSFLVINVCNQVKTLCSPCTYYITIWRFENFLWLTHFYVQQFCFYRNGWRIWCSCDRASLNLNPLTWRIWWAPNNDSKWQMGFNPYLANVENMVRS